MVPSVDTLPILTFDNPMVPQLFRQILRQINLDEDEPWTGFPLNSLIPEDGRSARDRMKDLAQQLFHINAWIRHPDGSESLVRFVSMIRRVPGSPPDDPDVLIYLDCGREALTYLRSYKDKLREDVQSSRQSFDASATNRSSDDPDV